MPRGPRKTSTQVTSRNNATQQIVGVTYDKYISKLPKQGHRKTWHRLPCFNARSWRPMPLVTSEHPTIQQKKTHTSQAASGQQVSHTFSIFKQEAVSWVWVSGDGARTRERSRRSGSPRPATRSRPRRRRTTSSSSSTS